MNHDTHISNHQSMAWRTGPGRLSPTTCLAACLIAAGSLAAAPPNSQSPNSQSPRAESPEPAVTVSEAAVDSRGIRVHTIRSPWQAGTTRIRVLLPDERSATSSYPVVYVLPVESGDTARWGDPLPELKQANLHNRHGVICVYPTFSHLPWYCDHPSDPEIRQETYFLRVVVPTVERLYPASSSAADRRLLGFSKSGWGACSLLLRHPDMFGRAVAWDAPLAMEQPGRYGSGPIFGDAENFERYRVERLLAARAESLQGGPRLALLGYDNFRSDHERVHALLKKLRIRHVYRDGPRRRHHWNSGWLPEALVWLAEPADG